MTSNDKVLERLGHALMKLSAWPGRAASWLILPIMLAVLLAVVGSMMRLQTFFAWDTTVPLIGNSLSLTALGELQWHLFAVSVMLGGAYALAEDRHIRVDFIYANLSPRGRAVVDLFGDLVLLLPFCAIVGWMSLQFVEMAFRSGERSDYGGLTDRYLVKAILPIGLALLFSAGSGRIIRNLGILLSRGQSDGDTGESPRG